MTLAIDRDTFSKSHRPRQTRLCRPQREAHPMPALSASYFSSICGERFTGVRDFAALSDCLAERWTLPTPRAYVAQHLSLQESAELYLLAYRDAARTLVSVLVP